MKNEQFQLIPRKVTIEGHLKVWNSARDSGSSDGSTFAVEYDVPDGIDYREFRRLCLEQKEYLDQMALVSERLKDSISGPFYKNRISSMRANYDKALGRKRENGSSQETAAGGTGQDSDGGSRGSSPDEVGVVE